MPKFRSTKELLKYLQSTIDEVLTEDVFPIIQEAEIDTIMEVVYSQKTSGYYRRRGDAEGMGDPYNIEIQTNTYDEVFIKKNSRNIASTIAGRLGSWKFPFVSVKPNMILEKPGEFEIYLEKNSKKKKDKD